MTTPAKPLKLQPQSILFSNNYVDDQKALLRVTNDSEKLVAYRLRVSKPAFYRMANAEGILEPGQSKDLEMTLKKDFTWEAGEVSKHKMICLTLNVFEEDFRDHKPITEIFSDGMEPRKQDVPLTLQPPAGSG